MGCCVQAQSEIIIKCSNIPLFYKGSLYNENENNSQKNPNVIADIVIPKQKTKSDKASNYPIPKKKCKYENRNIKSMNLLKEIAYYEVYQTTKYF